ncbi:hypothetical protein VPH35_098004 [Triticum aestivum]|uniref:Uncharacterized protein n=1 Tax=Aegilops tauschii subsp. strangulata TaxID=200361 RepID=A0A453KY76_AEGTS
MILLGKARNVWSTRCLTKYDYVWFFPYYCQSSWWKMSNHTNIQYGYCYKKCIVLVRSFQVGSMILPRKWAMDVHTMLALSKTYTNKSISLGFSIIFPMDVLCEWRELQVCTKLFFLCYMIDMLWLVLCSNFF